MGAQQVLGGFFGDEMTADLRKATLQAAGRWIGRKLLKQDEGQVVGRELLELMKERDRQKEEENVDWNRIEDLEDRIKEMNTEVKRKNWRKLLDKNASHKEMWKVIRRVSRRTGQDRKKGEGIRSGEKWLMTDRQKAEGFCREYEEVSRIKVPKEKKGMKRKLNRTLRDARGELQSSQSSQLTLNEVLMALDDLDGAKAEGPDQLHPRLLKNLPKEAIQAVRELFQASFERSQVPQGWREGLIVLLLKSGKEPSSIGSFRPVCFTSCLVK